MYLLNALFMLLFFYFVLMFQSIYSLFSIIVLVPFSSIHPSSQFNAPPSIEYQDLFISVLCFNLSKLDSYLFFSFVIFISVYFHCRLVKSLCETALHLGLKSHRKSLCIRVDGIRAVIVSIECVRTTKCVCVYILAV